MFGPQIAYAADGIEVHLAPHILGEFWGIPVSATLVTAWLSMVIVIALIALLRTKIKLVPGKVQSLVEVAIGGSFDYIANTLESRELAKKYFPVIMTIFIFVLSLNWIGLLPGVTSIGWFETSADGTTFTPLFYPANTDLNITLAFAIVALIAIELAGVLSLGFFKYAGKFINFKSPLAFVIGIIELISEMARLVSYSFRLFGNIFAGKVLLLVITFFIPYIVPVPMMAFEVFVGVVQAFIFAILTLFFIKLAVTEPH